MALELFLNILKLYSRSASLDNISFCCSLSSSFSGIQQLNHPRSTWNSDQNSAHNSNQLSPTILPEKEITILHLFLSYRKRMRLSAVQDVIMIKCLWNPQESTIRSVNNNLDPTIFALQLKAFRPFSYFKTNALSLYNSGPKLFGLTKKENLEGPKTQFERDQNNFWTGPK